MQFPSDSIQPTKDPPQISAAESKTIEKVTSDPRIQSLVSHLPLSSTKDSSKNINGDIDLTDSQLELSEDVNDACDLFFNHDKILNREKIDAAVDTVFHVLMDSQNQAGKVEAVVQEESENTGNVELEVNEVTPEMVKETIREELENVTLNTDRHFIIGDHEFHFSLASDTNNEHQIEIYHKIGELGQGAFGKVSEFKQLNSDKVYASKLASPKDGMPLYEIEGYLSSALEMLKNAQKQREEATSEEEIAKADHKVQAAQAELDNVNIYHAETKISEKDIKKEIKNQRLYNPDPDKPALGIQPRYHRVSSNLGTRYMIEKGADGLKLMDKRENTLVDKTERIQFNKKVVDTLNAGLDYIIEKGMCHSDIKPQNMLFKGGAESLLADDFQIYHADFGADKSFKKIISKMSDPADTTPINDLMVSTAAYTSRKIIHDIIELRKTICEKVSEGDLNIQADQAKMEQLIISSCKFSLGLSLIQMCSGFYPVIDALDHDGLLFGTASDGKSSYEEDLQSVVDQLYMDLPAEKDTQELILNLLGQGKDFTLNSGEVQLIQES